MRRGEPPWDDEVRRAVIAQSTCHLVPLARQGQLSPSGTIGPVTLSRRERKKLETRAALESAALRLFSERGFTATTVEDITEAADVARRTFFRYFPTKEAALFSRAEELLDTLEAELDARPASEDVLEGVARAVEALATAQLADRELHLARAKIGACTPEVRAHQLTLQHAYVERIARWVRERLDAGSEDLRPELIAATSVGALTTVIAHWAADDGRGDAIAMLDEAFALLGNGFGRRT